MTLTDELIGQLDHIEQTCFHGSWTREMLLEEINNPLCVFTAAMRGGAAAGFALGKIAADEAELYQIAVLPEYRRQGIAAQLLTELHALLKEKGAACCFLEVRSRNAPAVALYESIGYKKISMRKGYYGDDDAVIYRIEL